MPNLSEHKAAQAKAAESWTSGGIVLGRRAIPTVTMRLLEGVVSAAVESSSQAPLRETVSDMSNILLSTAYADALNADLTASQEAVEEALLEAMEDGLDAEMRWQTTQIAGLRWELAASDVALLPGYPIQGHTAHAVAEYMHSQLRYEVNAILSDPVVGASPANAVVQSLGDLVRRFGDRVGGAVAEAYYAGVQLAGRTVAKAIADAS